MQNERRYRACPLCEAICGLEFTVADGTVTAIRGDRADPFSRGHVCPKGNALIDLENDPDRLRTPLRRRGSDWEEVSWEDAFEEAATRLVDVQRRHGADAVGAYLGNPNVHHFGHAAYLPVLLRRLRSKNLFSASSVDQWPHQVVASAMYGHPMLVPLPDVDETDWMLVIGANPVASNGSLMTAPGIAKRLEALVARGRVIVVDPRRTETAEIASEYVAIRPGTDLWFLLGLLGALRELGPPRIAAYGERLADFDVALAATAGVSAAEASARCGVAAATIARLAKELHGARRACLYGRMGVSTQVHGTLCQWLLQLIHLYTGQLDVVGGMLPCEPAMPVTGPGTSRGGRARFASRVRGLPEFGGELPAAALAEEMATPGPGQIRALLTCAGNPVLSVPGGAEIDALLAGLEYYVAIDIYLNETTRHAHLILPPASPLTQYHYDLVFNAFAVRRVARLNVPLRPRAAEERADWEIFDGLCAAHATVTNVPHAPLPPPRELIARRLAEGPDALSVDALEAAPHGIDLGPLASSLLRRLQTPDGRIAAAPGFLVEALATARAQPPPAAPPDGLVLIGRRHVRSNNSWMHNAARLVKGKPRHHLEVHPEDLARRGVADGERVRLRSSRGAVEVEVRATDAVGPGVVCLPHGFGHHRPGTRLARANRVEGPSYNDLADPALLDGVSGNAAVNGVPVFIDRLGA